MSHNHSTSMVNDIDGGLNWSIVLVSMDIPVIRRLPEIRNARPLIVRHMFNVHRNLSGSRVILSKIFNQMQICAE